MNNLELAWNLITSPTVAFVELKARPRFWLPLVVLVLASIGLVSWYYSSVDFAWLKDFLISSDDRFAKMSPEIQERAQRAMTLKGLLLWQAVAMFVMVPLACAVQALYYWMAAKIFGSSLSYKHWFAMSAWCGIAVINFCGIPTLLSLLASGAFLMTQNAPMQVPPTELQVLSLNELLFHIPINGRGSFLLGSLTLALFWTWALIVICVRTWTQKSWAASATFALLPVVLWYGCGALIAFK